MGFGLFFCCFGAVFGVFWCFWGGSKFFLNSYLGVDWGFLNSYLWVGSKLFVYFMVGSKKVSIAYWVGSGVFIIVYLGWLRFDWVWTGLRGFGLEGSIAIPPFRRDSYIVFYHFIGGEFLAPTWTGFGFGAGLEGHILAISPFRRNSYIVNSISSEYIFAWL